VKLSLLCLMLLAVPALSTGSTLTFETQGVLFGFTPGQATYNGTIGTSGNAVFSIDPVLTGPTTGTLDLTFTNLTPLTFFNGSDAGGSAVQQFALDNLTFIVPEPATNLFIAAGLIALETVNRWPRRRP
jgi:hypothetical protein